MRRLAATLLFATLWVVPAQAGPTEQTLITPGASIGPVRIGEPAPAWFLQKMGPGRALPDGTVWLSPNQREGEPRFEIQTKEGVVDRIRFSENPKFLGTLMTREGVGLKTPIAVVRRLYPLGLESGGTYDYFTVSEKGIQFLFEKDRVMAVNVFPPDDHQAALEIQDEVANHVVEARSHLAPDQMPAFIDDLNQSYKGQKAAFKGTLLRIEPDAAGEAQAILKVTGAAAVHFGTCMVPLVLVKPESLQVGETVVVEGYVDEIMSDGAVMLTNEAIVQRLGKPTPNRP